MKKPFLDLPLPWRERIEVRGTPIFLQWERVGVRVNDPLP